MLIALYSQIHHRIQNVRGFSLGELHACKHLSLHAIHSNCDRFSAITSILLEFGAPSRPRPRRVGSVSTFPLLRPIRVYSGQETHRTKFRLSRLCGRWKGELESSYLRASSHYGRTLGNTISRLRTRSIREHRYHYVGYVRMHILSPLQCEASSYSYHQEAIG